jgi:hypothetical protein
METAEQGDRFELSILPHVGAESFSGRCSKY